MVRPIAVLLVIAGCAAPVSRRDRAVAPATRHQPRSGTRYREGLVVRFEKTFCFGTCPVFSVEVFQDGSVRYEGVEFVLHRGTVAGRLGSEEMDALRAAFRKAKFLEIVGSRWDCTEQWTDYETVVVGLRDGGKYQEVEDYQGCRGGSKSLRTLEAEIERILRVEQWIGTPEEREQCCKRSL